MTPLVRALFALALTVNLGIAGAYRRKARGGERVSLAALAAVALALVSVRIPLEHLEERFGDDYRDYRRRTGMFFPRL